jgi:hypothetical protein
MLIPLHGNTIRARDDFKKNILRSFNLEIRDALHLAGSIRGDLNKIIRNRFKVKLARIPLFPIRTPRSNAVSQEYFCIYH